MIYSCPVCGEKFGANFDKYVQHVESEIVELVKKDHPEWAERDGTCLKCYEYYKNQLKGET